MMMDIFVIGQTEDGSQFAIFKNKFAGKHANDMDEFDGKSIGHDVSSINKIIHFSILSKRKYIFFLISGI